MLARTVTFLMVFFTFLSSHSKGMENDSIPFEPFLKSYQRQLEPQVYRNTRVTLLTNNVGFLPGDSIGGMKTPYDYKTGVIKVELLDFLHNNFNVRVIVTLVEKPLPEKLTSEYPEITFVHKPIQDGSFPSLQNLQEIALLADQCDANHRLMVHCIAGMERTGTVLASLLFLTTEHNIEEIIRYIRKGRPDAINRHQENFLTKLAAVIEEKRGENKTHRLIVLEELETSEIAFIEGEEAQHHCNGEKAARSSLESSKASSSHYPIQQLPQNKDSKDLEDSIER